MNPVAVGTEESFTMRTFGIHVPLIFFLFDSHTLQLVWSTNVPTVMMGAGVTATSHNSCLLRYIPFPDVYPAVSLLEQRRVLKPEIFVVVMCS